MSKFVRQSNEQFNPKLYNNENNDAGYKTACQSLGPQAGGSNGKNKRKTRKTKKRRMRKGGDECSITDDVVKDFKLTCQSKKRAFNFTKAERRDCMQSGSETDIKNVYDIFTMPRLYLNNLNQYYNVN